MQTLWEGRVLRLRVLDGPPEMKAAGRKKVRYFGCQNIGHLKSDCPEIGSRKVKDNNNTESIISYLKSPQHRQRRRNPIVDSGYTLHLTNDKKRLTSRTTATRGGLIKQADSTTLKPTHKGNVTLTHRTGKMLTL